MYISNFLNFCYTSLLYFFIQCFTSLFELVTIKPPPLINHDQLLLFPIRSSSQKHRAQFVRFQNGVKAYVIVSAGL